MPSEKEVSSARIGIFYALSAYFAWGIFPIYWKLLGRVPAEQVLSQRIIWAAVFFFILMIRRNSKETLRALSAARRSLLPLTLSAILIGGNWFIYIFAVQSDRLIESSLGYFISPLVSIFLGRIVLKEKLSLLRKLSVILTGIGVLQLVLQSQGFPFIALSLASSFALYGLVRKKIALEPLTASTFEALLLILPALAFVLATKDQNTLQLSVFEHFLLIASGAVTGLPLLWFAEGAKRLSLSALGIMQYISPSLQLIIAIFIYHEPFSGTKAYSFVLIWIALILYSFDCWRRHSVLKLESSTSH